MNAEAKTTAMTDWKEEMARQVAAAAMYEQPTGRFISLKGGVISISNTPVPNNTIQGVIVDYCHESRFYPGAYDPDNRSGPDCYAFSRTGEHMTPHDDSGEKQHTSCQGCPQDEWGSGSGRGKACKQGRRLAILPSSALAEGPEGILTADTYFMFIPVTSVPNWQGHVNICNAVAKMPPYGVLTEITAKPDAKTMFKVLFAFKETLTEEQIRAIFDKRKMLGDAGLMFPFPKLDSEAKAAAAQAAEAAAARKANAKYKRK